MYWKLYILLLILFSIGPFHALADTCPTGQHMATSDDVAKGIPPATCVDVKASMLNGGCDYNPYQMLESKYRSGSVKISPVGGSEKTAKNGINPALACRLTKFFQAANSRGCNVKIISAYRSPQDQANLCGGNYGTGCSRPGNSCHQYGLAVDVSSSCMGWLRMAAPQFHLHFPYYGPHIQCTEDKIARCSVSSPQCDGNVTITPDLSSLPQPSQVPNTYYSPISGGNPQIYDGTERYTPAQTTLSPLQSTQTYSPSLYDQAAQQAQPPQTSSTPTSATTPTSQSTTPVQTTSTQPAGMTCGYITTTNGQQQQSCMSSDLSGQTGQTTTGQTTTSQSISTGQTATSQSSATGQSSGTGAIPTSTGTDTGTSVDTNSTITQNVPCMTSYSGLTCQTDQGTQTCTKPSAKGATHCCAKDSTGTDVCNDCILDKNKMLTKCTISQAEASNSVIDFSFTDTSVPSGDSTFLDNTDTSVPTGDSTLLSDTSADAGYINNGNDSTDQGSTASDGSQTFVSNDLADSPSTMHSSQGSMLAGAYDNATNNITAWGQSAVSSLGAVLEGMKAVLIRALTYLRTLL